jgi:threonylcarbamoyladenosine tRNA methylthiotransferase MtaB
LGCKQNQFDTESLRQLLQDHHHIVHYPQEADWFILNTCAVTQRALAKARGEIRTLKRRYPELKIIALGCGVKYQPHNFSAADSLSLAPLDLDPYVNLDPDRNPTAPHGLLPQGRSRALQRIQSGCEEACSYCIVPLLRGRSRSVSLTECVKAVASLRREGVAEIILTGTNIACWGYDLPGRPSLQMLLQSLLNEAGSSVRFRLSSLEPGTITPDFLEWCAEEPGICDHFHFAFQSGSSRVLSLMQRPPIAPELTAYLRDLKRRRPDFCLGSDFIVGFPGESADDFENTIRWIQSIPLDYLHVFPFSPRAGTRAYELSGRTDQTLSMIRARRLNALNVELRNAFIKSNIGTTQNMVGINNNNTNVFRALSSNYLTISLPHSLVEPIPENRKFRLKLEGDHRIQLQK